MSRVVKTSGARKSEIMDAAEALFVQKGFDRVPVQELLESVGIAKGTFYHHFASKEELLNAILERTLEGIGERAGAVAASPDMTAPAKLQAMLGVIFSTGGERRGMTLDPDDDRHLVMHLKLTRLFYAKLEPALAAVTRQGIAEGAFRTGDPDDVTAILLRGITGFIHLQFREMADPGTAARCMASVKLVLDRVLGMDGEPPQPQAAPAPTPNKEARP